MTIRLKIEIVREQQGWGAGDSTLKRIWASRVVTSDLEMHEDAAVQEEKFPLKGLLPNRDYILSESLNVWRGSRI